MTLDEWITFCVALAWVLGILLAYTFVVKLIVNKLGHAWKRHMARRDRRKAVRL